MTTIAYARQARYKLRRRHDTSVVNTACCIYRRKCTTRRHVFALLCRGPILHCGAGANPRQMTLKLLLCPFSGTVC